MAYVNVKDWTVDQVTDWLKGLDNVILPYISSFLNNGVTGHQLLNLRCDDLENLGVKTLGHQEIILEAVEHLRNFHFELDKENLQMLALRLSCAANSLFKELLLLDDDSSNVKIQVLSDVHNIITAIKPLVCWLDRSPFAGDKDYIDNKTRLLELGFEMATSAHRGIFSERPLRTIRNICEELAKKADYVIQEIVDPMILQPASLDLATLKKREHELGFFILPSNHAIHQIADIKYGSPAHGCSKLEDGDEIVQVNYQTVVGWQRKKVMILLQESPPEIVLTLKKRPRHTKVYGQIYMKPYRLPSRKRDTQNWSRWKENLPSPRLLDLPPITIPKISAVIVETESSSDSEPPDSPSYNEEAVRIYQSKPRPILQRRNTISGATPTNKKPEVSFDEYWDFVTSFKSKTDSVSQLEESKFLRDKSASCYMGLDLTKRPRTIGIIPSRSDTTKSLSRRVYFEEDKTTHLKPEEKCMSVSVNSLAGSVNEEIDFIDEGRDLTDRTSMTCDWQKEIVQEVIDTINIKMKAEFEPKDPNLAEVDIHSIIKKFDVVKPKVLPRSANKKSPPNVPKKPLVPPRSATTKLRGKLDKSHSTPAYDLTGDEVAVALVEKLPDLIPEIESKQLPPFSETNFELGIPLSSVEYTEISEDGKATQQQLPPKPPPRNLVGEVLKPAYPVDSPKPNNLYLPKTPNGAAVFEFPDVRKDEFGAIQEEQEEVKVMPKYFDPKVVSTPTTKVKMDFNEVEVYKNSMVSSSYEVPVSVAQPSKVSPTNSIVKNLKTSKSKSLKKKNNLIGKRRKVSVNDLNPCDIQGYLYQRLRGKHNPNVHWENRWFVLLGNCLYGFKNKDDSRAACLIFLSGFTVAVASEVKSKSNAFKVYHTGTVFYFSAEDPDALQSWIELIKAATLHTDSNRSADANLYSETDESDTEKPKNATNTPNEKSDTFKKFGSLKKFNSSKNKEATASGSTSLDRKWFFNKSSGHPKNPQPTAQFRSYRKMRTPDISTTSVTTGNFTSHVSMFTPNVSVPNLTVENQDKKLDSSNKAKQLNYIHASNPSLYNVSEFAVPTFKKNVTSKRNDSLTGCITLEELMNRQTEERKLNPHHIVEEMTNHLKLIKPDVVYGEILPSKVAEQAKKTDFQPTHSRSASGSQKSIVDKPSDATSSSCFGKRLGSLKKSHKNDQPSEDDKMSTYPKAARSYENKMNRSLPRTHKMRDEEFSLKPSNFASYEMIHCTETVNDVQFAQNRTLDDRMYHDAPKKGHKLKKQHSFSSSDQKAKMHYTNKISDSASNINSVKLKSAMQYTPMALPLNHDPKSKPKLAFELNLDGKSSSGKMKQIFGRQSDVKKEKEKTFLGSPKLRKAFFKRDVSESDSLNALTYSLENLTSLEAVTGQVPALSTSPPIDYPGMEYPPTFEAETYSLADPQSSLSILRKHPQN